MRVALNIALKQRFSTVRSPLIFVCISLRQISSLYISTGVIYKLFHQHCDITNIFYAVICFLLNFTIPITAKKYLKFFSISFLLQFFSNFHISLETIIISICLQCFPQSCLEHFIKQTCLNNKEDFSYGETTKLEQILPLRTYFVTSFSSSKNFITKDLHVRRMCA